MRMLINGNLIIREWISSILGKKNYLSYAKAALRPFFMSLLHALFEMI